MPDELKPVSNTPGADPETTEPLQEEPQENTEPTVDWKARYDDEHKRLEKAEFTLYQKNKAAREAKKQQIADTGIIDPDEIEKIVEAKAVSLLEAQRQKDAEDIVEEELRNLADDPDERAYIKLIYENRIQRTGYSRVAIHDDLAEAKTLAIAPKVVKASQEKSEIIKAKNAISNTGLGTNQDRPSPVKDDPYLGLTDAEVRFLRGAGADEKTIKQAAERKRSGILTSSIRP